MWLWIIGIGKAGQGKGRGMGADWICAGGCSWGLQGRPGGGEGVLGMGEVVGGCAYFGGGGGVPLMVFCHSNAGRCRGWGGEEGCSSEHMGAIGGWRSCLRGVMGTSGMGYGCLRFRARGRSKRGKGFRTQESS